MLRNILLFYFIGAILVGTATAWSEDFQNGADLVVSQNQYDPQLFNPSAVPTVVTPYSDTIGANANLIVHVNPEAFNILSCVYVTPTVYSALGYYYALNPNLKLYDVNGYLIGTYDPISTYGGTGVKYYPSAESAGKYNSIRIEYRRVDQVIHLYVQGQHIGPLGTCAAQPYYAAINTGGVQHTPATAGWTNALYIDDITSGSSDAAVVGIMPTSYSIAKDIAQPELSGMFDRTSVNIYNTEMHASYSFSGTPEWAKISIDGDHQVTSINTGATGAFVECRDGSSWVSRPAYNQSGIVTFDLTEFMAEMPYGRHFIRLETSDGTVEDAEFWYKGVATTQTKIEFDRDIYVSQDSININSTIGTNYYQPGVYSYKACLIDKTTGAFVENWSVTSQIQTHTTLASTALIPASGQYLTFLYAIDSTGAEILLDTDTCQIYTDKVVFSGTVYDAQQGTVISGATVSLTQSGTETQTTGSDGRFEFLDMTRNVLTSLSAAKSGFVTAWSNTTPTEFKRYEVQIALSPSSPAHTGEAVFGTVRSYPMGSFVESPTVRILKDGALVNSTTATAKGWYIFDGLDASTTYTVEVQKTGFVNYSNAVVTGSGGSSLTQFDPWLIPYYDLTVHLVDAVSMNPITALMAVSVGGQSKQTSTGTTTFENIQMGAASVAVVGSGYEANESAISMYEDKEITLYILPLAVVPTTNIPLTPTPTPALVGMIGTVYDGMTSQPITEAVVNVSAAQGDVTRTDTTDGSGDYAIPNIQNGVLTTVNATATGYTHTAFSFTPAGSAEYIVDLYMYRTDEASNPTIAPDPGLAGAGGSVLGGPYHELVESPTVTASNGTWSGPATLSADHVWYFTNLEPNTAYNFTASASGFITRSVPATTGAAGSFVVVPIILDGVYDVTITVKDADSYALILQPIQLSLSDGQTGNTSTGSYTFTNLEYASYVVSAASEGYTGGGISFLAYGTHTEYLYLAKAPTGNSQSIQYDIPPKPVEILARTMFGIPLSGVTVTAVGGATTLPDRDMLDAFFGWTDDYSSVDLSNATMTGTTGTDGGITFMMADALKYNVTFSDPSRGIDETVELMPHDNQYVFILGGMSATPTAGMPNMTLWAVGEGGASPTLTGYYNDPAGTTTALYFVVQQINGTVKTEVSNQSLGAVQTATATYAVNHTTGAMYSWGFRASTPDRGALERWNGITLHSRLIELPIEESRYFWVTMCLVFVFAGLFSGNNIKFGFVAFPMFCALLWYIGWLDVAGITLGVVMVMGVMMYLTRVQVG